MLKNKNNDGKSSHSGLQEYNINSKLSAINNERDLPFIIGKKLTFCKKKKKSVGQIKI